MMALHDRGSAARGIFWVVSLVVIGVLGYLVYTRTQGPGAAAAPNVSDLARYLCRAHEEGFASPDVLTARTREKAWEAGKDWLGKDVTLEETIGKGLEFRGAGRADVPSPSPDIPASSARYHFVTDGTAGPAGQRVSMFLQVDRWAQAGLEPLQMNVTYALRPDPALGAETPDILVCRKGGIIYFLVGSTPEALAALQNAYAIPPPTQRF